MLFLQRSPQALLAAGAALVLAGPAFAADQPGSRFTNVAETAATSTVAMLPPLPSAPRVFAMTPERKALLNTIRFAEGTWANGHEIGYRVMFGGSLMPSLERHPDRVMRTTGYASAAAGAYQFMPFTWDLVTRTLGIRGFHPEAQDQGALLLIQRRGALALADQGQLTPHLAAKLAPEWASFPTLGGYSYYGQPVKRFAALKRFYDEQLARLRSEMGDGNWETVAIQPAATAAPVCTGSKLACQLQELEKIGPRSLRQQR